VTLLLGLRLVFLALLVCVVAGLILAASAREPR